jgi:nucleoside-diphosphate-sugar epimerase
MAVLIVGAGYLGASLAVLLLDQGRQVVALENGFSTDPAALAGLQQRGLVLVQGDMQDPAACRRALELCPALEAVFLLAAQASAAYANEHPDETEELNLRGPRVFLDVFTARPGARPLLIFGSSLKVCGPCLTADIEDDAPYGLCTDLSHLSKIYVEKLLEMYAQRAGLAAWSVRLPVLHGVSPVMKRDARFQTVLNRFCAEAVSGELLRVHAGAAGCFQGFLHVLDAAAALAWLVDQPAVPGHRTLVTPCEVLTVSEVATIVQQVAARHGLQVHIEGAGVSPAAVRPVVRPGLIPASFLRRTVAESAQELFAHFAGQQRDCVEGAEPG